MTEAQGAQLIVLANQLVFLGQVCALGVGVLWGAFMWRLTVLAKNQKNIW